MGVDIYFVFQRREADAWVDVPSTFRGDRDYDLASWLGFGGGDKYGTYYMDKPIAPSRGLPPDFEVFDFFCHPVLKENHSRSMYLHPLPSDERYAGYYSMGDRAHSWLLSSEILAAPPPTVLRTVEVPVDEYAEWDLWDEGIGPWQCDVSNWGHPVGEPHRITHGETTVDAEWLYDLAPDFRYFTDEVLRLHNEYGEVRFVFGFDR